MIIALNLILIIIAAIVKVVVTIVIIVVMLVYKKLSWTKYIIKIIMFHSYCKHNVT
jgi:hypothetical protein